MAATGWFWDGINRQRDLQTVAGVVWTRNNWRLTRFLRSNDVFASSLGATATSLDGDNGGVEEVVDAPTVSAVVFGFSTAAPTYMAALAGSGQTFLDGIYVELGTYNSAKYYRHSYSGSYYYIYWTGAQWELRGALGSGTLYGYAGGTSTSFPWNLSWTPGTGISAFVITDYTTYSASWGVDADRWISTGLLRNGYPIYVPYNAPNTAFPGKQNAAWYSAANSRWCVAPVWADDIANNTFEDDCSSTNYPDARALGTISEEDISASSFSGLTDWSSTTASASLGAATMFLLCIDDSQTYPNPFTDHYIRKQEWVYQDSWVRNI